MKKQLGAEIELIGGANGIFDVNVDGAVVFSKFKQGRFPDAEDIVSLVKGG